MLFLMFCAGEKPVLMNFSSFLIVFGDVFYNSGSHLNQTIDKESSCLISLINYQSRSRKVFKTNSFRLTFQECTQIPSYVLDQKSGHPCKLFKIQLAVDLSDGFQLINLFNKLDHNQFRFERSISSFQTELIMSLGVQPLNRSSFCKN